MIKVATVEDIPRAAAFGMQFNHEFKHVYPVGTVDDWINHLRELIESDDHHVLLSERGIICGGLFTYPHCSSHRGANECVWWAKDGQGMALLRQFTKWAASRGATEIIIAHQLTDKTKQARKVLGREGYEPFEIGFRRSL